MKKTTEPSTRISDDELRTLLTARAAKAALADRERLKKEADLHRAVLKQLMEDDSTKS